MMRILTYTTLFPNNAMPNAAIFIQQRMFHFAKLPGCALQVVAPIPYCPAWWPLERARSFSQVNSFEIRDGVPVYHSRYPLVPKISMQIHGLLLFLGSIRPLTEIQKTFHFDLIDAHYIYPDCFAGVLLGRLFKKPVVVSARGSDINQFSSFSTIKPMLRYTLNHAASIISVCGALKQEMISLGAVKEKIAVIPNGVDTTRFFIVDNTVCRARLSIEEGQKIILSVGSLIKRKGFELLIEAIKIIRQENPEVHLYIIGDGLLRGKLESLILRSGLEKNVILVGERPNEELVYWYNAADVFCLASSREGWANVIMEALACGCPVVATNVYGAPEILTEPHLGRLVVRGPQAIANAVNEMLSQKSDRKRIRDHVISRDWNVVASEVENVFRGCLASKG